MKERERERERARKRAEESESCSVARIERLPKSRRAGKPFGRAYREGADAAPDREPVHGILLLLPNSSVTGVTNAGTFFTTII